MTAKDSSEAVSTLRGQCNNIDVVITDYHMPGLNGVQLKRRIDEEFGSLPVIGKCFFPLIDLFQCLLLKKKII